MNSLDQLFIRACKSKEPRTRIRSVYNRFYLRNLPHKDIHIIGILANLCEKYTPMTASELITELSPEQ